MPFSSGTYSVAVNFTNEASTPPIAIAKLDTQMTDMATALSTCILRDGTGTPTTDIPWNGKKITGLGAATTNTDAAQAANGFIAEATIASATTTDLGTAASHLISITGTTTITAFGSSASTSSPIYFIQFAGALTLTHNGSSLIIPGAANITTVANDFAIVKYLGSGNWRVLSYFVPNGRVATYEIGTFTGTLTGCTTAPTATFNWSRAGNIVTIDCSAGLTATSNSISCTITGMPAGLAPARTQMMPTFAITDNNLFVLGAISVTAASTAMTLWRATAGTPPAILDTGFTSSGTKGITGARLSLIYNLT